jgi:prophage endopeptidase
VTWLRLYWKPLFVLWVMGVVAVVSYGAGRDRVQQRWDKQNAEIAQALTVAFEKSANETEVIRATFIEYKKGAEAVTAGLERDVLAGRQRLRVKATCVPNTANAGGTGGGTAELDATARQDYYTLRRGIDEQRGLLNLCRAELKKRSTASANSVRLP